ncbi:YgaP family membrane protein [Sulfurospirillum sp. 1612]|uniref:YgaP family membrane protein n=1 Tax=Sulfurospirillum sp. 1612 TaxID=3094835 RepID=UPI002F9504D9
MNTFDKIRRFCRVFRIILGIVLIGVGVYLNNAWFYLGIVPLIAGLTNFCPLCIFSKKCST